MYIYYNILEYACVHLSARYGHIAKKYINMTPIIYYILLALKYNFNTYNNYIIIISARYESTQLYFKSYLCFKTTPVRINVTAINMFTIKLLQASVSIHIMMLVCLFTELSCSCRYFLLY